MQMEAGLMPGKWALHSVSKRGWGKACFGSWMGVKHLAPKNPKNTSKVHLSCGASFQAEALHDTWEGSQARV